MVTHQSHFQTQITSDLSQIHRSIQKQLNLSLQSSPNLISNQIQISSYFFNNPSQPQLILSFASQIQEEEINKRGQFVVNKDKKIQNLFVGSSGWPKTVERIESKYEQQLKENTMKRSISMITNSSQTEMMINQNMEELQEKVNLEYVYDQDNQYGDAECQQIIESLRIEND